MAKSLKDIKMEFAADPMRAGLVDRFLDGSESRVLPYLYFIDASDALALNYNEELTPGSVSERSLNEGYNTTDSKKAKKTVNLAMMGGEVRTDMVFVDAKGNAARQNEIDAKMRSLGKYFDRVFFNGDASANPKQLDGLRRRSVIKDRVIWAGDNGGNLTQDLLDQALDTISGENSQKVIFCDRATRRYISKFVKTAAGGKGNREAVEQLQEYNGARIVTVSEDESYQPIITNNETRGSSNVTRSLYVVRFGGSSDQQFVQGVRGPSFMTHRDIGPMGTYYLDVIDNVVGFEDFGPNTFMRLGGLLLG